MFYSDVPGNEMEQSEYLARHDQRSMVLSENLLQFLGG